MYFEYLGSCKKKLQKLALLMSNEQLLRKLNLPKMALKKEYIKLTRLQD